MKNYKVLALFLLIAVISFSSCGDKNADARKQQARDAIEVSTPPSTTPATPTPPTAEPAQNTAGVWHYTCSNGCAGGAGSAIACASCGSTLSHNSAYHN